MFLRAGTKHSIAKIALITNIPTSFYCIEKSYLQWPDFLWKDDVNNFLWTWSWHDPCIPELSSSMNNSISSEIKKLSSKTRPPLPSRPVVTLLSHSHYCKLLLPKDNISRKILYLVSNVLAVIQYVWTLMKYHHQFNKIIEQNSSTY